MSIWISKSHAGGRVATGRACHAGEVKGDDPDKKGYSATPGWGLSVVLTLHRVKFLTAENFLRFAGREILTLKEAKVDDEVYRR
jgi:hypothetical protein